MSLPQTKVEILDATTEKSDSKNITVEIAGEVIRPGVYKIPDGSIIDDLVIIGGGFSGSADRVWVEKYLNRASKLTDGQKVYIPKVNEQSNVLSAKNDGVDQTVSSQNSTDSKLLININTASLTQLDSLPGIGQVYGQSIIEHRPYSTINELLSKGVLKQSVFNKLKDLISVY